MLGIINLNKPKGKTSHDMVYFVRKTLGIKQVGHTGTLDPLATGVLPILVGKATKLSDMLMADSKEYIAKVKLGIITDTQDITGTVLEKQKVTVSIDDVKKVLSGFVGEQEQMPPMYSALKVGGEKLYTLARRGITIEREKRKINIFYIDLLSQEIENDEFKIRVGCSKGTYIRTLCEDIGTALSCGAVMSELTRTKTGVFSIDNSYSMQEIESLANEGKVQEFLISVDSVLCDYEKVVLDSENEIKVKNGIRLRPAQIGIKGAHLGKIYRIYDKNGMLIVLSEVIKENNILVLKQLKSFY